MTHAKMAIDIYNKLNLKLQDKFKDHLSEYITFSQGADIFFFYPIRDFLIVIV